MLAPEERVLGMMGDEGIDLVATLPCDRTKNLLSLVANDFQEIRLTREENGVGICAGAYLAGAMPMMIIQSTGIGNMLNALASLNIAGEIPLPILASWRGHYKEAIEAQMPLGLHLPGTLVGAGIRHTLIDKNEDLPLLSRVIRDAYEKKTPHIALVSPQVWENSSCLAWKHTPLQVVRPRGETHITVEKMCPPEMIRYEAISVLAHQLGAELAVVNLGVPSKEFHAIRDREQNYYMTGSMGLVSSIGLGVALRSRQTTVVFDGDGSLLMNPNAIIEIGSHRPANLILVALDNGCYGSTGSQETLTCRFTDLELLARSAGINNTVKVYTARQLERAFENFRNRRELSFIHVVLKPGNTAVSNIPLTPAQITARFRNAINQSNATQM